MSGARVSLIVAALVGALAVAMGAFSAHGMAARFGEVAAERGALGAQYQVIHALAAVAACLAAGRLKRPGRAIAAAWAFLAGCVFFPGALYALALGGPSVLGAVAPIGGLAFILGWLMVAWGALGGLRA
ncbi:MAG: DUF423 domain-containing protein [Marivibrio sp.]|uniref:DUF423 domain-containing protein n=1 Tax=Marivibrio sp. TaxID=2039719 RepID=UPI0032EEFBC6